MTMQIVYVEEGWWHPNVKSGQVHDHKPNQPATMHRLCEPVYTKRQGSALVPAPALEDPPEPPVSNIDKPIIVTNPLRTGTCSFPNDRRVRFPVRPPVKMSNPPDMVPIRLVDEEGWIEVLIKDGKLVVRGAHRLALEVDSSNAITVSLANDWDPEPSRSSRAVPTPHDCERCGMPNDECNRLVRKKGRACCAPCGIRDTHGAIESTAP